MSSHTPTTRGLIIAAPASGSGKTFIALALLRAFKKKGVRVAGYKVGPDYIDPAFHTAAADRVCYNLDTWAMRPDTMAWLLRGTTPNPTATMDDAPSLIICEGVMGLFDGAGVEDQHDGSTADVARLSGWPVVLVVDATRQGGSAAALVRGFATHDPAVRVAGVIFNRVAGARHRLHIERAMMQYVPHMPVLGYIPHFADLALPERHLGLVLAREHDALDNFLDAAADAVSTHVLPDSVQAIAAPLSTPASSASPLSPPFPPPLPPPFPPLGTTIAVAQDDAFCFSYPHQLAAWRDAGAAIVFFSPLRNEAVPEHCDAVFLPGGYPELHATRLSMADQCRDSLHKARDRGAFIYGECGGYMALGDTLVDKNGTSHAMMGLLPVTTSFAEPKRHLGYRRVVLQYRTPLGKAGQAWRAHEFHYAQVISHNGTALCNAYDAQGTLQADGGVVQGNVAGSFYHFIDTEHEQA